MGFFDKDYNKAKDNLKRVSGAMTGETGSQRALNTGTAGAAGIGQTSAGTAYSAGVNAGMTEGQAKAASQNVANEKTLDNIQTETERAQEEQNAAVKEAENKVGEEAEKKKENESRLQTTVQGVGSGAAAGASLGSTIGSVVPGLGTAIGAVAGGLLGGIGGGFAGYFSDDRLKYHSKIIDKRLLSGGRK